MQPIQISSKINQSEQLELIEIVKLRNKPDATRLDFQRSDRAFSKLLKFYEKSLWKLTNKYFGKNSENYSVALHAFYKAIESFRYIGSFSAWAQYKVRFELLSEIRTAQRNDKIYILFYGSSDLESIVSDTDYESELTEVENAIIDLSDYQQKIIKLYTNGYNWPEIGNIVGKSPDAVRMEMQRTLVTIRKILGIRKAKKEKNSSNNSLWMRQLLDRFKTGVRIEQKSDDIRTGWVSSQKQDTFSNSNIGLLPTSHSNFSSAVLNLAKWRGIKVTHTLARDRSPPSRISI